MKFLILSDIHGDEKDLQTILSKDLAKTSDLIVLCGDYLNHGPRNPLPDGWNPRGVADLLNPLSHKIIAVRGNCDAEVDEMVLKFPCLAPNSTIFVDGIRFFIHHGHLYERSKLFSMLPPRTIVISGHTHVSLIEEEGDLIFLNPGSISLPKSDVGKTFATIEVESKKTKISLWSIDNGIVWEKNF